MAAKIKTPNSTLRRIRELERRESREEFARAVVAEARKLREQHLACDARLVARWEDGDIASPRPIYQRVLSSLLDRPFEELGFGVNAVLLPPVSLRPGGIASETINSWVDEEGQMWVEVNRRGFLVGSAAALLQAAGALSPVAGAAERLALPREDPVGFASAVQRMWPGLRVSRPVPDYGVDWMLLLPGGQAVEGATAKVQVHPAQNVDGRVLVDALDMRRWTEFSRGSGRGLLVAADISAEPPRFFAVDTRVPRHAADRGLQVSVPTAYELDDLSCAILWATANLDAGLQADDQELSMSKPSLAAYENLPTSAVSRDAVPDLTAVSRMWLGSDFCAGHILRHLDELPDRPIFWTREQRGEEASTWLLFGHKYEYLRKTQEAARGDRLIRGFCIPDDVVRRSPRYERILLLLAVALMECCGIEVNVTPDPAFAEVDGFVLGGIRRAIVANWVRSEGMWRVDTTERRSILLEYGDVSGQVEAHSVIDAPTPVGRLQGLAGYLELDFPWLRQRCRELGRYGTAGIARPRSRLISTAGLDAACSYVGSLPSAS